MQRLVLAFIVVILLLGISFGVLSATITVSEDYLTIQEAIDAAQPGDTVYIKAGVHRENLVIDKPLSLVGEDRTTTIIRSPDAEQDVITINLSQRNVDIAGIKVSDGDTGIYIHVDAGVQVTLNDVIVSENQFGVTAFGDGSLVVTGSYFVDNALTGFLLGNAIAVVESNEIIRGEAGVILLGAIDATLDDNLIGLCQWGIDTYIQNCGWRDGEEFFSGAVAGTGNRVYALNADLCPGYPGSPWPVGFVDEVWQETVARIGTAFDQGVEAYSNQDYQQALEAYSVGLAQFDTEIGLPLLEAGFQQNIAIVYWFLGRYEEVLASYQSARVVFVDCKMEVEVAEVDANLGDFYSIFGCYEEAVGKYEAARAVYADRNMEVNVAWVDANLGDVYGNLGWYKEALAAYESARVVYVEQRFIQYVAEIDTKLGGAYDVLGRHEEAVGKYEAAWNAYAAMGMIGDGTTNNNISSGLLFQGLGQYEAAVAVYRAVLEFLDSDPPIGEAAFSYPMHRWILYHTEGIAHEALDEWDEAVAAYESAIAVIESIRGGLTSEKLKLAWQERTKNVYERLVDLLYRIEEGASAFTYAERCRARTFLDLLAMGPVGTIENVVEEGIRSGVVEPFAIEADVDEVARSLPSNTAALEYFVTDTATYVWLIYQGEIQEPIQLKHGRTELLHKVIETREQLGSSPEHPFNPRNLVEFYDWLIRPVESLLPKTTGEGDVPHLIIIPSGPLYYLPFQALIWTSEDLTENAPLIARYALSYSPSLATLKYAQALADTAYPQATFLALADPDSGDPRLPDAQTEARMVAQLFTVSSVHVDSDATEDVVQSQSATAREVLLSTHGLFNPHNPMYSYLVVSPTDRNSDGKLYAYEVFNLTLHANMVVLSACETLLPSLEDMKGQIKAVRKADDDTSVKLTDDQLEKLTAGDEVVGLTRAFISAGTSSVLSSLWSIPSGSTSQLMVSFYKHREKGMDKAQALRAAQLEVMNMTGCTQPWYWAAFNLMGDWR